ncbi:hypothetical protein [Arthrobacter sp.]|uniref:hypothetical protein n=1 Tax=Arthrobacter sp. TaxID=1667 RepID=UPI003395A707
MISIDVTTSEDGVPIFFALDGQDWLVGPQPVRWFERVAYLTKVEGARLRELVVALANDLQAKRVRDTSA